MKKKKNEYWRHIQENESRAPPTQKAVKRILSDYQEILKSNHPLM